MKKLLIIDGHNLLFKMFFGMPFPFYNDNKLNITGTVGFVGTVVKMIKYLKADECLVVFDGEGSRDIRKDINYKANRQTDYGKLTEDKNPFTQLKYIKAVLDYLNIRWIETEGIECDDYIAIISEKHDGEVFISSTDSDFLQLVNDKVKIIKYRGKNTVIIDERYIYEKYSVLPSEFALYKAIIGDSTDNIKGIYKVGPKTAVSIINSIKLECHNKYNDIYKDNLKLINNNLSLIELPNKSINVSDYKLESYKINATNLKNFKNLKLVTGITNSIL